MSELRIVTLTASATEIVCALGAERNLVGISHECDYPEHILNRPRCTRTLIDPNLESSEIDEQVRQFSASGVSLYQVDEFLLKSLRPNVIITQTQCDVCAVSPSDLEFLGSKEFDGSPLLLNLEMSHLSGLYDDILEVARAIRKESAAFELCAALRKRLERIRKRTHSFPKRSVVCIEWLDPIMISGNWMPELVECAGGRSLLNDAGGRSATISFQDIVAANPDVIVFLPCGFPLLRTLNEFERVVQLHDWESLPAFRRGTVYAADGNAYFNRPGPRLADSAEILAQILHPAVFDFPDIENAYRQITSDFHKMKQKQ